MTALTIFFDGRCPLCAREIQALKRLDQQQLLQFEDIHAKDFQHRFPAIDLVEADRKLHGQRSDGKLIYGLDVTAEAWALVGKHRWLAWLRLPVIHLFSDVVYWVFARFRHPLGRLFKHPTCEDNQCPPR